MNYLLENAVIVFWMEIITFFFFCSLQVLLFLHAQSLSHVQLFVTPRTVAYHAPLSMGFSRQEYWSRWPFSPPGDLPNPGTEPVSPVLTGGFFTAEPPGKPYSHPSPHQRQGFVMVEQNGLECACKCVPCTPAEISYIRYLLL